MLATSAAGFDFPEMVIGGGLGVAYVEGEEAPTIADQVRLVDGSKAYLHAVIDNFSRRILSWRIGASFDPGNTVL